jgi:hypothetical protein
MENSVIGRMEEAAACSHPRNLRHQAVGYSLALLGARRIELGAARLHNVCVGALSEA